MSADKRIPTMSSSLKALLRYGVDVKAVIDVGILSGTQPLMRIFTDVKHYLFELVEFHFERIRKNHNDLDYEPHNVALSDADGYSYLIGRSADGGNSVTHSNISDTQITEYNGSPVLVCKKIKKAKLDTVLDEVTVESPYLLKVDVDGHELPILRGARNSLRKASIVVIEAPLQKSALPQFLERLQYMLDQEFALIDIVDFAY